MAATDARKVGTNTAVASDVGFGAGASAAAPFCRAADASRATRFIFIASISPGLSLPPPTALGFGNVGILRRREESNGGGTETEIRWVYTSSDI